jgi:hypothetical protein
MLTYADLIPLLLIESMLQKEFTPVSYLPTQINLDIQKFGRRNLWHGIFSKSFSGWIYQEHRTDAWLGKFSIKCILSLHEMWIEFCTICHECTTAMIRAEYYDSLKCNVVNILETHSELPSTLEVHREKVESMSSDLLRTFLYEFYALTQDRVSPSYLNSHALNSATRYRPDITSEVSELQNATTNKSNQASFKSHQ